MGSWRVWEESFPCPPPLGKALMNDITSPDKVVKVGELMGFAITSVSLCKKHSFRVNAQCLGGLPTNDNRDDWRVAKPPGVQSNLLLSSPTKNSTSLWYIEWVKHTHT